MLLTMLPSNTSKERKKFAGRKLVNDPTKEEIKSFNTIQKALLKPSFLVYFNNKKTLFIDLDSSRHGIGAIVYYIASPTIDKYPSRSKVRLILFLLRLLYGVEVRYQPTEIELASIIQILSKIHYIAESASKIIVYTDYSTTLSLAKQILLSKTTSIVKLNLKLIMVSNYI